ncbi:MAG: hypothetical protein ACOX6H_01040 [Christensenellales bacterium]|jgi:hypothetical protein
MRYLLANVWLLEIKRFIRDMESIAFIAIVGLMALLVLVIFRFIVKNTFNVNTIKKNIALPSIIAILTLLLLVFMLIMRAS